MRVHGAWIEFPNKFPDHSNMTFEETDGGLDRSHESLDAAFKTRQRMENTELMIAPCTVMLLVPKTRTRGSTTLLPEKVLLHILSEVFMPLCKS